MMLARLAAAIGLVCGLVELGRVAAGLGLEAQPVWLVESLIVGLIQLTISLAVGVRPSARSLGTFLFVFGVASVWDGSKFLVGYRLVYLLPVAALASGLLAWPRHRGPDVLTGDERR